MTSIGELYFSSNFFLDEESKTIGQPLVGENMGTILKNRHNTKGMLTPKGMEILKKVEQKIGKVFGGRKVKLKWDKYCGCSMCPCSPGFRVMIDFTTGGRFSEEHRFKLWINKDGSFNFRVPKNPYYLGIDEVKNLETILR